MTATALRRSVTLFTGRQTTGLLCSSIEILDIRRGQGASELLYPPSCSENPSAYTHMLESNPLTGPSENTPPAPAPDAVC